MSDVAIVSRGAVPPAVRAIQERAIPGDWHVHRVEGADPELRIRRLREAPTTRYLLVDRDIGRDVIDALPDLRLIQVMGVGYDSIDVEHATARGVAVTTAVGLNSVAVAEYTIGLALAAARNIARVDRGIRAGGWPQHDHRAASIELQGKTWGAIGFGQIGREVGRRAHALGMRVRWHDVVPPPENDFPALPMDRDELLRTADVVSLHVPLTPETRHLIDARTLALMQPAAILVNTARGGLVDTRALADALAAGRLGAAALDVFEDEPLGDSPLRELDNAVLSPHAAAGTRDTIERVLRFCVANVTRIERGEQPLNRVN